MKKMLIISYFFPPLGGGGVIRVTKFTKYLPEFGWQPRILTVQNPFYPFKDTELLKEIPGEVKISRINYFEPAFWFKNRYWQSFLAYFLYPLFLIPDRQILWFFPALVNGYKIIKKEKIKVIFTSSAPASDHLIGWALKKFTGVKWVADFRDEWSNNPLRRYPTFFYQWLNRFLEKQVIRTADKVISVSEPITSYFQLLDQKKDKFFTITNGYDSEDFKNLPQKKSKHFHIVYTGTIYNPEIIQPFGQAVKELNFSDLKVTFIGYKKRLPHREAVKMLASADILLLILDPVDRPAVLTGKLFEYLAARKPILALAPENSGAAKLIHKLKIGEVALTSDKEKIKEKIILFYKKFKRGTLTVPLVDIEKYDRKKLTENLANILDNFSLQKKIKLCLIGNLASPQNRELVEYFKKDYDVSFISTKKATSNGIKTYDLGNPGLTAIYFWRSLRKIKKIIKMVKPDIVHGQDLVFAGIWGYLSGFRSLVVTSWGSDVLHYNNFIFVEKYLIRKTLQAANLVIGTSLAVKNKAIKIGMAKNKFELVHFGIDLNIFQNKQKKPSQIIFCPRAIAPLYNIDILVKAFSKVAKKNSRAVLALLLNNIDENYLLEIEKLIIKFDLVDKVQFWPQTANKNMVKYYNSAEVVVSITSSDGCSASFLEAMACENKIVVSDLPYIKEWLKGHNLWVVPVRDEAKTAQAIASALKFAEKKWRPIGRLNRQIIAEKAEINSNFEKLDRLYRKIINF